MRETRWDSLEFLPPALPLETQLSVVDDTPRLVSGSKNCFVTASGSIAKRWRTDQYSGILTGKTIVKMWMYETLPTPATTVPQPYSYILMSVRDNTTGRYSLYSKKYDASDSTAPSTVTVVRSSNTSVKPHKIVFVKGLAYVKFFPASSSGEKYGTIILDGTSGSIVVRPWGIPGPTEPAHISGEVIRLTASVTASATTFNTTDNSAMPATPYDLWIGYEKVTVTAEPTTTSLTVTRGAGGTTAEAHDANEVLIYRDWDASDHQVEVKLGWKYAFAYVSITGQVSNRSDVEYNPDLMPSNTGPFYDLIPKIDLTLDSWFYNDTTTYPYLNMYRTTDGGGTFYFLEQVANPGTSTLTYEDDSFGTGANSTTYNDPVPDLKLDTARYAPSLTSNSVPPSVNPPLVVGTDTPSESCYAMTAYASRIWIAIDHYLHFSSREETRDGVGEECFPSGNLGNFFILDAGIVGMAATKDALYVITTNDIWKLTGTTIDTFAINKIAFGVGGYTTENCAIAYRDNVAFATKESEFAIIENDKVRVISKPVEGILTAVSEITFNLNYYRDKKYEWLIFSNDASTGGGDEDQALSKYFIYDILRSEKTGRDFWQPLWVTRTSCTLAARSVRTETTGLFGAITHIDGTDYTCLINFVTTPGGFRYDRVIQSGGTTTTANFESVINFGAVRAPTGNHINALSLPSKDVNYYGTTALWAANSFIPVYGKPTLTLYHDNDRDTPVPASAEGEPRIQVDSTNDTYDSVFYPSNFEVKRVYPTFSDTDDNYWELLGIHFTFDPKANP